MTDLPYPAETPRKREDLPDKGAGSPAPWGLRSAARLLDLLVIFEIWNLLIFVLGIQRGANSQMPVDLWARLLFPVMFIVYEAVTVAKFGQTLGKFICRVKVVQWSDGALPSPREAAVRALVPGVFLLIACIGGPFFYAAAIGVVIYLTSIADTLYRGIHEKTSNTIELFAPGGLSRRK
ncbi:MAG: RDD family protein [Actinomycetes bacterium]